jgi:hypothetical protein
VTKKPKKFSKRLALVFTLLTLLVLYLTYWAISTNPLSTTTNPKYGFPYYKPTMLPSGFSITKKRIDLGLQPQFMAAEMNLRDTDWVYEIRETNGSYADPTATDIDADNYNPSSISVTCTQRSSPKGQGYRLCHWVDYGKVSVYEVKFIKLENMDHITLVETEFPSTTNRVLSAQELNTYVDSFIKARATGFKLMSGGI